MTPHPVEELPREYRLTEPIMPGEVAVIIQTSRHYVAFSIEDMAFLANKEIIVKYTEKAKRSLESVANSISG